MLFRSPDHRRLDVHVGFSPTNVRSPSYPGMLEERTSHVYLLAAEVSKDWNPEAFKWGGDLRVNVATKFTKKRLNTIPVSYAVDVVATGKLFQDSPTGSSVLLAHQAISFTLGIEEIQTQAMKLEVFAVSVSIIVTVKNSHATIAMLQDDW